MEIREVELLLVLEIHRAAAGVQGSSSHAQAAQRQPHLAAAAVSAGETT